MLEPYPAKLAEDKLEVSFKGQKVLLTKMEALQFRLTLNAFINGELEEEEDDAEV